MNKQTFIKTAEGTHRGGRFRDKRDIEALPVKALKTVWKTASAAATHNGPMLYAAANNVCDANADTCCIGKNFVMLSHVPPSLFNES
jgi:hypothetical protein